MRKMALLIFALTLAGVVSIVLVNIGYKIMVETSTPSFCASCHEIKPAVEKWRTSSHASNEKGFTARCMDCHLPPPEQTISFFFSKAKHGIKDFWGHFFGDPYDAEKRRSIVYSTYPNTNCVKCHQNILFIPDKRGAMLAHRAVVYQNSDRGLSCFECHRDLVHKARGTYSVSGSR